MTLYKRIGLDTSKAVFTVHGIDHADRPTARINLSRGRLLPFFRKLPPTEIALEACAASHHWARELTALGHATRLIPPQYVKPYVKRGKNDQIDAAAIREAAGRPDMRFVPVKSAEQQAGGMVLKVRALLVTHRSALINALRGHAGEFGVIAARGTTNVKGLLAALEREPTIPDMARAMTTELAANIAHLDDRIAALDKQITAAHKANETSRRLASIPGIGPQIALTLVSEIDAAAFRSGRHLAAWIGLTPRDHSTGGKQRLGRITRAGNERLRALLVTGATAVIGATVRAGEGSARMWLRDLLRRKSRKCAAVALANKMARVVWVLMTRGGTWRAPRAGVSAAA